MVRLVVTASLLVGIGGAGCAGHASHATSPAPVDAPDAASARSELDAGSNPSPAPPVALETSLDGTWEYAESCHGAALVYTLTIAGARGELVTASPAGQRSQPVELRPAPSEHAPEVGALITLPGDDDRPLFRLVRSDANVLSRYTLGAHAENVALGQSNAVGAFRAQCSTFISFIERGELARQAWSRLTWGGLAMAYPSKVFGRPRRTAKELALPAPHVHATSMAGQEAMFQIRLGVKSGTPSAALGAIFSIASSWTVDDSGPMMMGNRGVDLQMGIEGVGQHYVAVGLRPGTSLLAEIDWVDAFANEALTMSSEMQLAIADRLLSSLEPVP